MKIVLVNYRYFISGGPERYMFNIMEILENNGHEIIPFSVKHNKNVYSKYEKYFLDPIGTGDEIYGHEYKNNISTIIKAISRVIYSFEAKQKMKRLLLQEKPDLVYVLQFQNKISCSVIDAAYELKVPVVQRISDFGHICIDNIFYHYQSKVICESCLHGSKWNAIIKKCSNNSYLNSIVKTIALKVHDYRKIREKITSFIIPAHFTVSKFVEFGVPIEKINLIPTFFDLKNNKSQQVEYQDYFLYVGRVDPDKGLLTLVKAFINTPYKLIIVGSSIEGYDDYLKEYLKDKNHNITFTGQLKFSDISEYLKTCLCTLCPSEWYDNLPNAVLESYAYKKAVIASDLGSLKDLIIEGETGVHFIPGDVSSLKSRIEFIASNPEIAVEMGNRSYSILQTGYSSQFHYQMLMEVFERVIADKSVANTI